MKRYIKASTNRSIEDIAMALSEFYYEWDPYGFGDAKELDETDDEAIERFASAFVDDLLEQPEAVLEDLEQNYEMICEDIEQDPENSWVKTTGVQFKHTLEGLISDIQKLI